MTYPTNNAQKITKDSQHVASDGGNIKQCPCQQMYTKEVMEKGNKKSMSSKFLFYSLIEICSLFSFFTILKSEYRYVTPSRVTPFRTIFKNVQVLGIQGPLTYQECKQKTQQLLYGGTRRQQYSGYSTYIGNHV